MKINEYALVEISREKGASILFQQGIPTEIVNKLLIETLPFGTPEPTVFKQVFINDKIYISYLEMDETADKGRAILLAPTDNYLDDNPFSFISSLKKQLRLDAKANEIDIDSVPIEPKSVKLVNFDQAIFCFFSKKKVIIVGSHEEISAFLSSVLTLVPPELRFHIRFVTQSSSLSENVDTIGMPLTDSVLDALDKQRGKITFVILANQTVYGIYTSPFCKKLSQLMDKGEFDKIPSMVMESYKMCIESDKLEPPADFAKKHKIPLADAVLLMMMRANHFNLEFDEGFLSHL